MTGVDPGAAYRGRYRDRDGALRVLEAAGGLGAVVARHGLREIALMRAGRGDLVLLRGLGDGPEGLGICVGTAALVAAPGGLTVVARRHWRRAWRV